MKTFDVIMFCFALGNSSSLDSHLLGTVITINTYTKISTYLKKNTHSNKIMNGSYIYRLFSLNRNKIIEQ